MKILIVDDKIENTYLLESLLKGNGYETISARNGVEALNIANREKLDLIVSDILMPVMDGFTLCREIKKDKRFINIPFIFYTATYTDQKDEDFALSLGADKFLLKPQDPDIFIGLIENCIKETMNKKNKPVTLPELPETIVLKQYNQTLIRKLEHKMMQTEENEKALKKMIRELENSLEERKLYEKRIALLAQSIRSVSECISITDDKDNILFVNEAFIKTYGYSEKELIGENISKVHSDDEQMIEQFKNILPETLLGGWKGEVMNKRKDGTLFPVSLSTSVVKDENGKALGLIGVAIDITEMKRNREELIHAKEKAEEMNKLKSYFFANMSHELRTPFVGILNGAEILSKSIHDPESKELAEIILQSSKRLIDTLNKILNLSKLEFGKPDVGLSEVNITSIIDEVCDLFYLTANKKHIQLINKKETEPITIKTDGKILRIVLENLISNAIKYTDKGTVIITVEPYSRNSGKYIIIKVSDTGTGIDSDKLELIWQEFRQGSEGYGRQYE
jgi:PAS domain S-box-containing protein